MKKRPIIYPPPPLVRPARDLPPMLVVDDKYAIDGRLNQSFHIQRLCDLMEGDLGDFLRVRAHPTGVVRAVGPNRLLPGYRAMWLINGTPLGEGGWLTTSGGTGFGYTEKTDTYGIAPPVVHVGQIGDIVILTADDVISVTPDGDLYTLANIRHDAHFHYDASHDGRIFFTTTPPGHEPTGPPVIGEMVCDPAKANVDTALNKESGEWRPQIKKTFPPDTLIYPNSGSLVWPDFTTVGGTSKKGAVFPKAPTTGTGWGGDVQVPNGYGTGWDLGVVLEYCADNATGADKNGVFKIVGRVIAPGENMKTGGTSFAVSTNVPILDGSTEQILRCMDFGVVASADLADGDMIIIEEFYRDYTHGSDTLNDDIFIVGFKPLFFEP